MDFADQNPYQSPAVEMAELVHPELFVFDNSRLTLRECWDVASNPLEYVVAILLKMFRIRLPAQHAIGHQLYLLPWDQLPEDARRRLQPLLEEGVLYGLRHAFMFALPIVGNSECFAAALRSDDGRVGMWMAYTRVAAGTTSKVIVKYNVGSLLQDGTFLETSASKPDLQGPSYLQVERLRGMSVRQLLDRHYERLAESRVGVVAWTSDAEYEEFFREHERRCIESYIARGVFRHATERELNRLNAVGRKALPPMSSEVIRFLQIVFLITMIAGVILDLSDVGYGFLLSLAGLGGFVVSVAVPYFYWWLKPKP